MARNKNNGMSDSLNDQYKYFVDDQGSTALPQNNTNEAYLAVHPLGTKTIRQNPKTVDPDGEPPKTDPDPDPPRTYDPYPTYYSPTAGAHYSYGGTRPTWSWDQTAPTYSWDQVAPTWSWDDSGRPEAFQWDDSGKPGDFAYDKEAPTYNNAYQDRINAMVDQILNRPQFSYDYAQDPLYAQYADAYTRNGTQAMNDTLAQVSARTGGLASSYASNAAQQQYNSYMNALNDKIPELYQLAYGMYRDQGNDMRSNLSMLQGLENTDYGRYMDALGQYNTDRNLAYNVWNSGLNQYNQDRNFAYNQWADQMQQYNTDRNFSYGQYADALQQYNTDRNFSFDQYQTALNQYNNDRNFDYGVYADALSQYNTDRSWDYNLWQDNISRQEAAARAAYNSQVAAWNAKNGGGSSGSVADQQAADTSYTLPYAALKAAGITNYGDALNYLIKNDYFSSESVAGKVVEDYLKWLESSGDGGTGDSGSRTGATANQYDTWHGLAGNAVAAKAIQDDTDQYDYGVFKTKNGIEFMGQTYRTAGAVLSAILSANIPRSTKVNALGTALREGIITQQEYDQATK